MQQNSSEKIRLRAITLLVVLGSACGDPDETPDHDVGEVDVSDSGDVTDTPEELIDADATGDDGELADVDADVVDADTSLPGCGDGVQQVGEECDDGNVLAGDGCSGSCLLERCGDGVVQPAAGEECEPALSLDAGCDTIGFASGVLACDETCRFDVSGCVAPGCGNGVLEAGEQCDDAGVVDGDGCSAVCLRERCVRGGDADGDGTDDCDDVEDCDGIDNNGDGLVDNGVVLVTTDVLCDVPESIGQCRRALPECRDGELVCVGGVEAIDELCNGLDDNCDGSVGVDEADCGPAEASELLDDTEVIVEAAIGRRAADIVLHVDVTSSMSPTIAALRTLALDAAPWRWSPAGFDVAWALVAQADFSLSGVSAPHTLLSRITTSRPALSAAVGALQVLDGGDVAEPWDVSLWRIATGGAVVAESARAMPTPAARPLTVGTLSASQSEREYSLVLDAAATIAVNVLASRVGSPLDSKLALLDGDGAIVASSDDANLLDPAIFVALAPGLYRLQVSSCCGAQTGWYGLEVAIDGVSQIGDPEQLCGASDGPVAMLSAASVWPLPAALCQARCQLEESVPSWLLDAFCGNGLSLGRCGDGRIDAGEACDDQNTVSGDGCDARCASEGYTLPAWRAGSGFSDGLGHGLRGGVGFRAGADAFVVHLGDASATRAPDGPDFGVSRPVFDDGNTLGATLRDHGVYFGGVWFGAAASLAELKALAVDTGAWAPACAFDDHSGRVDALCGADQCCTGPFGSGYDPDAEGRCGLILEAPSQQDIEASIGEAVAMLLDWSTYALAVEVAGNTCVVHSLAIDIETARCAGGGAAVDLDGDNVVDTISGLRRGDIVRARAILGLRDERDVDGNGDRATLCESGAAAVALVNANGDVLTRFELLVDDAE